MNVFPVTEEIVIRQARLLGKAIRKFDHKDLPGQRCRQLLSHFRSGRVVKGRKDQHGFVDADLRLAGAIGCERAKYLTGLDLEVDSFHGVYLTVRLLDAVNRDRCEAGFIAGK
jgi:hypothetical protein